MPTKLPSKVSMLKFWLLIIALLPRTDSAVATKSVAVTPVATANTVPVPRREATAVPAALRSGDLNTQERKHLFIKTVLPLVLMENERLQQQRRETLDLLSRLEQGEPLPATEQRWLRDLAREFRIKKDVVTEPQARDLLRRRVDIVPVDLALAQAALESGWGRSRHARKNHDLFGLTGIAERRGAPKFETLRKSVHTYIRTLNSHAAYERLRKIRAKLRATDHPLDGAALAAGLTKYSSLGETYVRKVQTMIRHNHFARYRHAVLVPESAGDVALLSSNNPG
jgi:Bax protein